MTTLLEIAEELYAGRVEDFTATRDALAKEQDDKAFGKQVKALKKPTIGAWAVNLLVRRETEQLEQVFGLAESLREAADSMDGAELRGLNRQRRRLTTALANAARTRAREVGVKLTPAVVDQVEGVLTAAMLDPVAAEVVRSGLLTTTFSSTGLGELDPAAVAVPDAVGHLARPAASEPAPVRPKLTVVRDDSKKRRDQARAELAEARSALSTARRALSTAERRLSRQEDQRAALADELDDLRQRLAEVETQQAELEVEAAETAAERDRAQAEVEAAEAARDEAQSTLDDLD